ncbi:gag/pol protein [Cucumis melo var. makuwa]|uniref:Gag/pol protein n=1 Tax=Cucumis melo var. makuwa TaxID=1194695 RepID=A0A5A7V4G9_CUCMM|nr:gag/pol protein [Cucumis melo var. makuwa]
MNSSIVQLLASKKLDGDNYAAWKSNLNTILVVGDLRFVLTKECPQTPTSNANRTSRKAYDRWIKANEKARVYILASVSDVFAKNGKGNTPKQNKKKKTTKKGKCYHYGENGHWLRNCPKYLAQKKAEKEEQGKYDLLENSSWKRLAEGEITLKVGTGEMVSAKAVGDLKIGRLVKSGLLSQLEDNSLPPCDSCPEGKMTKRSSTRKGLRAKSPLELVHSDLCGPMNIEDRGGYEYFISFIDDYSRYGHIYLIQNKSDSFEKFKEYKAEVENESVRLSRTVYQKEEPRRSWRVVRHPDRYLALSETQNVIPYDGIEDPLTYKRVMNDMDCDQWIKAMDLKMESMYSNYVWSLVDQPNDMDVKTAFLNGNLEESVYMVQPEGYKMQNSKKGLLPYKYGIHLSKEQCSKTPQEVEDMINIPYASAVGSLIKSTSISVFTLNEGAVVWRSIKQSCIADSTMEAEYVAACEVAKEVVWLKKFLTDLEVVPNMHQPITLYCDNSGAVANSREPRSHKRGKHIE